MLFEKYFNPAGIPGEGKVKLLFTSSLIYPRLFVLLIVNVYVESGHKNTSSESSANSDLSVNSFMGSLVEF